MIQQDQIQDAMPVRGGVESIGYNHGVSMPLPKPSASAAVSAGAVGPGALAAAETSLEAIQEAESGLTSLEIEDLRNVARRLGGVDALIRWCQMHPDLR
jgi:hypothetical protein